MKSVERKVITSVDCYVSTSLRLSSGPSVGGWRVGRFTKLLKLLPAASRQPPASSANPERFVHLCLMAAVSWVAVVLVVLVVVAFAALLVVLV